MRHRVLPPLATALLAASALPASADPFFDRVATFMAHSNVEGEADKPAVAEIISANADGTLLVYTDAAGKRVGMIDINDPANPKPLGTVAVGGEPTSVKIVGTTAYVAVDTSESFTKPTGKLLAVDTSAKSVAKECELPGQPDSVAAAKDGAFLAIAMENQRDEETNDGNLPQLPAGSLVTVALDGAALDCARINEIALTGLASVAGEDPEPEFVDINERGEIVVTLQENNAVVLVDGKTGKVTGNWDAGRVDLDRIDTEKDGVIRLDGKMENVAREPDGVAWLGNDRVVTANEGDWKGGTRGFTIFLRDGTVQFDPGNSLEHAVVALGHYPEKRNKKGIEIEGVATGTYGDEQLIFVGSERASVVAVYRDREGADPDLLQVLPGGIGPEGLLAIPSRNLFVTATETDLTEDGGIGGQVVIYQRAERAAPAYPTIASELGETGLPIPWGALSGLAADKATPGRLYAVTDSAYGKAPRILTIDATRTPAAITAEMTVTKDGKTAEDLDLEGIAVAADGGFWLASEGNAKGRKNLLLKVDAKGAVQDEIALPAEVEATATASGYEGVTVTGEGDATTVWLAQQRPWKGDAEDEVKLFAFKPASKEWGAVRYKLEPKGEGWVGLSEITADNDRVILIERDNQIGSKAKLKRLYAVPMSEMKPAPLGGELPLVSKAIAHDFLPELQAPKGYVLDKIEGFALDKDGNGFAVTDNDGVDDASGETQFLRLGRL
ncbi:esterase-like activity of phytase family protein [Mesorhizobium sp. RP14(2022)]|uniref:Esterase-like activity of phytase family protein n=1 Tax=Mesorhizobium liriopis TaxID=2953882 RepID=A0ABT1C2D4_9HYPH|nr:esterase-like activity of phytase family protein [Mesorhizobium liriopis]MCO6048987.1 esterase-like activity of phytase family protein [Mesorhizobium liriopis]